MTQPFEIFVPVKNSGALLGECLRSLLDQTDPEFTVTVIDDGSTDGTPDLVARMGQQDPRLRYRRFEEPTTLGGNFTRCIDAATADHFAIVHADDRVLPGFVEGMKAGRRAHPEAWMVFCQAYLINDAGERITSLKNRIRDAAFRWRGPVLAGEGGLAALASYNHLVCPCGAYRRDVIAGRLSFDGSYRYLVDQIFWIEVLLAGGTIAQISDRLYEHRVHAGQASSRLRGASTTLEEIDRFAPQLAGHPRARRAWRQYRVMRDIRTRILS